MKNIQLLWAIFALHCASSAHSQVQERSNLRAAGKKAAPYSQDFSQGLLQDEEASSPQLHYSQDLSLQDVNEDEEPSLRQLVNVSRDAQAAWGESELWGRDGELWDPENSQLLDFTDVGYKRGNEPIPDWPVWKNVTEYGAVPDDDKSDVQAFLDAMEDCPPQHAILVPNGRFIIDRRMHIKKNDIVIRGESRDDAILFFPKHMSEVDGTARSTGTFITFSGGHDRGIENLSLVLRDEKKATGYYRDPRATKQRDPHWYYAGERPIQFTGSEKDSWMRNVYIKNANYAISISNRANQISFVDVVVDNFLLRRSDEENTVGHFGVILINQPSRILIHNMLMTGSYVHDISPMGAKNNVFSRIKGPSLRLDHHAMGNSENLFTEIDAGRDGGYGDSHNNYRETYWNIKSTRKNNYLATSRNCVMVGINTDQKTSIGSSWHHETIDPEALVPANIYLAQMAKKPGKWVPPHTELTLPPPISDKVFQILPVDDAHTRRWDWNSNYGRWSSARTDTSTHEIFMKFDLNKVILPDSVPIVKLRLYVNKVTSGYTLYIFEVDDNSWSENTLTYGKKPDHGSVVSKLNFEFVEIPGWVEVDISNHSNKVLSRDDRVMSLKFDGSLKKSNKDKGISISTKEGSYPPHLTIYLDESMVPAPAEPTGLVVTPGYGHITLDWEPNTESDFVSYNLYRSVGSNWSYKREAMGLTTPTYTDYVNLEAYETYTYKVTAVDIAGSESTPIKSLPVSPCKNSACEEEPLDPSGPNPDGWCEGGTYSGKFCCDECGGMCGGSGCDKRPGGGGKCCMGSLKRICSHKQDTACIIPTDGSDADGPDGDGPDDLDGDDPDDLDGDDPDDLDGDEPDDLDGDEPDDLDGDEPDDLDGDEADDLDGDEPDDLDGDEPIDDSNVGYPGPDPAGWCEGGTFLDNVCCGECDGECGGSGCSNRTGGGSECCTQQILRVCSNKTDIGCLIPKSDPDATQSLTDKPSPAPTRNPTLDTTVSNRCSVHTSSETCRDDYNCFWGNGVCSDECPESWLKVKCVWEKRRNAWRWRSGQRPIGGSY